MSNDRRPTDVPLQEELPFDPIEVVPPVDPPVYGSFGTLSAEVTRGDAECNE